MNLYVIGDVRDAEGNLQNFIFTIVDSIKAGETKGFEQAAIFGSPDTDYANSTINASAYIGII